MVPERKTEKHVSKDEPVVIETRPGSNKEIGGGEGDKWNFRQMQLMLSAIPGVTNSDKKTLGKLVRL